MPCAHPIPAVRPLLGGAVVLSGVREIRDFGDRADAVLSQSQLLFLPCGTCVGCQLSRARSWAVRCSLELSQHSRASFVTLTFQDRYVPPSLRRSDITWFVKRLRKMLPPRSVRHFCCGEYGDLTYRPHYHALLFGTEDRSVIEEAWGGRGWATVSEVTPARISYVAGYCAKKVGFFGEASERVDRSTGEIYRYQPPFLQMSRRPGIGGESRKYWRSWRDAAIWGGRKVPVPRFLHASWDEHASVSEKADLEREKRERQMTLTVRELNASEAMATARARQTEARRKV